MLKQFVIVPKKPKMSAGKIASQVAHATFMVLETEDYEILSKWKTSGMCVIILQCKDIVQLSNIAKYLDQWDVPNYLYIDEGMTEVDMGTPTALATGILDEEDHWMFSKLKTYK